MKLQKALLAWYDTHKRNLPWRHTSDPYAIWISEIMLQQTQVVTVIPYYERFLKRFPDIKSLANAPEKEVLELWAGLGYYSRARNLHKAAQEIVKSHGGKFPQDFDSILALPGIGRYTAGAISSIALGKPYPVLDGNVARVFSRLFLIRDNVKEPAVQKKLWALAEELMEQKRPGDWNQALMELGATVCLPETPLCISCPLSRQCKARFKNTQNDLPNTGIAKKSVSLFWNAVILRKGASILLSQRKDQALLKDHWGLPSLSEVKTKKAKLLGSVTHSITHHKISVKVYAASAAADFKTTKNLRWVKDGKIPHHLVSSLWLKALKFA